MKRHYINQTGDANKFWTVEQEENSYTVTWGKIGTQGRTNTKTLSDSEECRKVVEKLIGEKLSKGYQEINDLSQVQDKPVSEYKPMDEEVFWEIIKSFDWNKTGDDDAVLRPAVKRLVTMTVEDIYLFADILSEKLFKLDGIVYASEIGDESYKGEGEHFSVDYFLYVRCCVVANGKDFFKHILGNPTQMPKDMDFEALLYLPAMAYNKKTKSEGYDYEPKFDFETFSNVDGWNTNKNKKAWWKLW